ncbi:unnamed protein product [Mesocestoides corti]|uniref:Transposase n=1 Tax=Mesocestoides corti TaxID=53468 RepID=A0A0R3UMH5_MESCO|nr:unnamed protein product [Mesocestoides corti]
MSHSTSQRSFLKDVQQLYRTIDTSIDGQDFIVSVNELYFKTQRIRICYLSLNKEPSPPSVFYYSEFLGSSVCRGELSDLYSTLFAGDVLPAMQVHPESRQTSSL